MQSVRYNLTPYILGGIVFIIATLILKPFAIVGAGERGVIMRFGKVDNAILDEGIHPIFPIVTSVKTRSRPSPKNRHQSRCSIQRLAKN
ncbi:MULTISPECIES: SPFH domain-containing protein [unclassified Microcoleus]|uniref:SPFH domain-containing protein n=1 Tax=unclassified Microcoleus TaxID=2642155 RepID=UPI0025E1C7B2|nr:MULTISPECIES: SPFH domain-containing protein [unclassified Microcoleus]